MFEFDRPSGSIISHERNTRWQRGYVTLGNSGIEIHKLQAFILVPSDACSHVTSPRFREKDILESIIFKVKLRFCTSAGFVPLGNFLHFFVVCLQSYLDGYSGKYTVDGSRAMSHRHTKIDESSEKISYQRGASTVFRKWIPTIFDIALWMTQCGDRGSSTIVSMST